MRLSARQKTTDWFRNLSIKLAAFFVHFLGTITPASLSGRFEIKRDLLNLRSRFYNQISTKAVKLVPE
jgi:hypothetical protein